MNFHVTLAHQRALPTYGHLGSVEEATHWAKHLSSINSSPICNWASSLHISLPRFGRFYRPQLTSKTPSVDSMAPNDKTRYQLNLQDSDQNNSQRLLSLLSSLPLKAKSDFVANTSSKAVKLTLAQAFETPLRDESLNHLICENIHLSFPELVRVEQVNRTIVDKGYGHFVLNYTSQWKMPSKALTPKIKEKKVAWPLPLDWTTHSFNFCSSSKANIIISNNMLSLDLPASPPSNGKKSQFFERQTRQGDEDESISEKDLTMFQRLLSQ